MVPDWLEHYGQQNFHHQVSLFVVSVSIATGNPHHRHLVVEEILIELVVGALHDYYCLVLIHLRKYEPTLVIQTNEMAYLLQLRLQLHSDHFFVNLELF